MNVSTLSVPWDVAVKRADDIKALKNKTPEDEYLLSMYRAVRRHNLRILDLRTAFTQTGVDPETGHPRLGFAASDWSNTYLDHDYAGLKFRGNNDFWRQSSTTPGAKYRQFKFPADIVPGLKLDIRLSAAVPYCPPDIRPKDHLRNYCTLWECEKWNVHAYSKDPFLLKHIHGCLFAIVAEWELTDLEASLLGSMRSGGN